MQFPYTGKESGKLIGPWPCQECKKLSQYAMCDQDANRIFCKNPYCGFRRTVLKQGPRRIIVENDGSIWEQDTVLVEDRQVQTTIRKRGEHEWQD